MKNNFIAVICIMAVIFSASLLKADMPPTNEEFVSNSITQTAAAFFDSLKLVPSRVRFEPADGLNKLAVDGVKKALIMSGWSICNDISLNSEHDFTISAAFSAFDFRYKKGPSRGFLRKPHINRDLSGQLLLNISSLNYSTVNFLDFSDSDSVLPEQENYIASIRYKELTPSVSIGGVERYLEPLAVAATVGGLIYLFFVNR